MSRTSRIGFGRRVLAGAAVALALGGMPKAEAGPTVDNIRSKGVVSCGMTVTSNGFGAPDPTGKFVGFNVDVCKAIAAAIIGQGEKIKSVPLSAQARFTAIQSGEVDILLSNATWTLAREGALGLLFAPTYFYDGQGFLVPKKLGVTTVKQLSGATICVQQGTTTELNLTDYFRANNMTMKAVVLDSLAESESAFFAGRCDSFTNDATSLTGTHIIRSPKADDYLILPERISKEPLAPAVRQGDDHFFNVVRWTIFALIEAEERGITQRNVDELLKSNDPGVKRLLGVTQGNGKALGLDEQWAYNAIKAVGNYGEIFERHLGKESPIKLERGLNDLWSRGGLMYAPPAR
jgi:general L-amino acid transport system substrate-binding protein